MNNFLSHVNDFLYSYILIFLLVGAGIYFSIRTRFVQLTLLKDAFLALKEKSSDGENASGKPVSSFQALMISTASRVGTGNIAGIATALAAGGPGAIFWMWIMAVIGGASAFVESTLAQVYKVKDGDSFRGGPSYYIERALKKRWLGVLFSVLLICCFAYGFNGLQAYNISSSFEYYVKDYSNTMLPAVVGAVLALLTAVVIFGGVHRISFITSVLVPIMAGIYILVGVYVTASAAVSHPVKQGLVQILSVFIDTLLICTTTAFILLLSNVKGVPGTLDGIPYVQAALQSSVGTWGIHFITFSIFAFAFTSLVGNYYYAEANILFIKNSPVLLNLFRITCLIAIFFGAQANFSTVWNLADVLMGLMALVNIFAILLLGNIAFRVLDDYRAQKKQGKDPVFQASSLNLTDTDAWN